MTAPVLDDYALQFDFTGLLMNGDPLPDGTIIDVTQIDGLDSAPAKQSTASYEGRDGGILNAFNEDMRKPVISGTIYAGSNPIFQTLDILKQNFEIGTDPKPLFFQQEGTDLRQVFCKSLGFNYSWTAAMRTGTTPFTITLQAEDPTIYGTAQRTFTGALQTPSTTPGYQWSRAWSYSWGGGNPIGLTLLPNLGTKYVGFTATLQNQACTNPRIICDTQPGKQVTTDLTVGSADIVVFDFFTQSLYLNGQSRHGAIDIENWFKLQRGLNSVRFMADSVSSAQVTYSYYDGYR